MNRLITIFTTLALGLFLAFPVIADNQSGKKPGSEAEVRVYEVFGMDCPACQGGLTKLIRKVEGVSQAKAEWKTQRVVVTMHPSAEVKDEAILSAIKKANFTPGKRIDPATEKGKKE